MNPECKDCKCGIASKSRITETIGFIGGGNMAKAIAEGIVKKGKNAWL